MIYQASATGRCSRAYREVFTRPYKLISCALHKITLSRYKIFFFALIGVFCGNFIFELVNNVKHKLFKL